MLFIIKLTFVLIILWFLLFLFGSATMIDPALDDKAWWSEYLGKILAASPFILACVAALICCIRPSSRKNARGDRYLDASGPGG